MRRQKVKVTWLAPEAGGRSARPTGESYATIARFPEDGPEWPDGAWTVVLDFETPPSAQGNVSFGTARFLMPEAPQHRLRPGGSFQLHEGLRKVATVDLLGE